MTLLWALTLLDWRDFPLFAVWLLEGPVCFSLGLGLQWAGRA
jgi:hypothetical protein